MGRYGKEKKKLKMMQLIKTLFLMIISTFLLTIPVYANPVMPGETPWVDPKSTFYEDMMSTMFLVIPFELFLISWLTVTGIILYNSENFKKRVLGFRVFQVSVSLFILAVNGFLGDTFSPKLFILVTIVLLVIVNIFMNKKIKRFKGKYEKENDDEIENKEDQED